MFMMLSYCTHRVQYVASCMAEKMQPRFSLKTYDDLRPKEKETFIRPVHAGPQQEAVGSHYGQCPIHYCHISCVSCCTSHICA